MVNTTRSCVKVVSSRGNAITISPWYWGFPGYFAVAGQWFIKCSSNPKWVSTSLGSAYPKVLDGGNHDGVKNPMTNDRIGCPGNQLHITCKCAGLANQHQYWKINALRPMVCLHTRWGESVRRDHWLHIGSYLKQYLMHLDQKIHREVTTCI